MNIIKFSVVDVDLSSTTNKLYTYRLNINKMQLQEGFVQKLNQN